MDYITRKSLIYKTAVEYGDYTLNHVLGCSHGCKYPCYAMLLKKRFGEIKSYQDWTNPRLVSNYKEILEKELPKYKDNIDTLHLCFTTDPFMVGYPEIINASIDILNMIASHGVKASVLTKGVYPEEMAHLPKKFSLGITLISLDETFRSKIEPGSAPYKDRIESLKRMSDLGFHTWVSIEPYPTPNIIKQDLITILDEVSFVNKIIFGRMNYNKEVTSYKKHKSYFNDLAKQVIDYCKMHNIDYHIKDGTITPDVQE
jgi:DNA repair photolyase